CSSDLGHEPRDTEASVGRPRELSSHRAWAPGQALQDETGRPCAVARTAPFVFLGRKSSPRQRPQSSIYPKCLEGNMSLGPSAVEWAQSDIQFPSSARDRRLETASESRQRKRTSPNRDSRTRPRGAQIALRRC